MKKREACSQGREKMSAQSWKEKNPASGCWKAVQHGEDIETRGLVHMSRSQGASWGRPCEPCPRA